MEKRQIVEDDEITFNMALSCERHPRPIQVIILIKFQIKKSINFRLIGSWDKTDDCVRPTHDQTMSQLKPIQISESLMKLLIEIKGQ